MGNSKKELNTFRELVDSLTFSYASVTQLVECHLAKVIVEGSNPFARSIFLLRSGFRTGHHGSVAQLVEQLTLNQRVQGSSPCTSTT